MPTIEAIIESTITALANECAAEARRQGAPARQLTDDEDAGRGDYDALDEAMARLGLNGFWCATKEERRLFRMAYSAALTR